MSEHQNNSESLPKIEIEEEISNLEVSLDKIKQRYQQIKLDQGRKDELINRQQEIKQEIAANNPPDSLKSELNYIKNELAEIEVRLESELFQWSHLSEPFWQAVRFVGIGIIIGWILKNYS